MRWQEEEEVWVQRTLRMSEGRLWRSQKSPRCLSPGCEATGWEGWESLASKLIEDAKKAPCQVEFWGGTLLSFTVLRTACQQEQRTEGMTYRGSWLQRVPPISPFFPSKRVERIILGGCFTGRHRVGLEAGEGPQNRMSKKVGNGQAGYHWPGTSTAVPNWFPPHLSLTSLQSENLGHPDTCPH